jgi:hypothetical protein
MFLASALCLLSVSAFAAKLEVKYQNKNVIQMKRIATATTIENTSSQQKCG